MKSLINKTRKQGGQFGVKWAKSVIKYRWLYLAATILIVMAAGYGGQNLGFNSDYHVFFSEDNPQLLAYDALQNKYTKDDNVFIVIQPKDGSDVFTKETLEAVKELADASWQTPYSSRVDAITNFQYTRAENDDLYVDDLIGSPSTLTESQIAEVRKIATTDVRVKNRLVEEKRQTNCRKYHSPHTGPGQW